MNAEEMGRIIEEARFTPTRIREGYDMAGVDQLLDRIRDAARRGADIAAVASAAELTVVKRRAGYDIDEVDAFLERVCDTVVAPARSPAAVFGDREAGVRAMVVDVRFSPVRLHVSYDMGEVDEFLDSVVAALDAGQPLAPLIDRAKFTRVKLREGYDIDEVDRFLLRLRHPDPLSLVDLPVGVGDAGALYSDLIQERRGLVTRFLGRS